MASATLRRIRAVGFDFDHTLGIDNKLERVAFLHLLETACERGGRYIGTLAQEIESIDTMLAKQRAGDFSIDEAVAQFFRDHDVPGPTDAGAYKRLAIEMVPAFVIAQPGLRQMLAELRRRAIPYAILSNGWSPLQQHKAKRVGFDGPLLVSAEIGAQKPQAAAFAALARALNEEPASIAFVGDTPSSDVAGALAAGMQGIWLDAEGLQYPSHLPAPSAVIHSLAELPGLM